MKNCKAAVKTWVWIVIGLVVVVGMALFSKLKGGGSQVAEKVATSSSSSGFTWILVIGGGLLLYWIWKKRKKGESGGVEKEPGIIRLGPEAPPNRIIGQIGGASDPGNDPNPPKHPKFNPPFKKPSHPTYKPPHVVVPKGSRVLIENIEKWFLPVRNQGGIGACACFAGTSVFEYIYNQTKKKLTPDAKRSELFLYYNVRSGEDDNGTSSQSLSTEMRETGNCDYHYWPFRGFPWEDYHKKIPAEGKEAYKNAENHVVAYTDYIGCDPDDWIGALAQGHPLWISVKFPTNLKRSGPDLFDKTPKYANYRNSHHAMVVVGYDSQYPTGSTSKEAFRVRNSWGSGWRDGGYVWISRDVLEKISRKSGGAWIFRKWIKKKDSSSIKEDRTEGVKDEHRPVYKILDQVQEWVEAIYDIKVDKRAKDLFTDDTEWLVKAVRDIQENKTKEKVRKFTPNPKAETLAFSSEKTKRILEIILYINPKIVKRLEKNNPLKDLNNKNYKDFLSLAEEVSHFVYDLYYDEKYKRKAEHCTTELVGAIDKYYITQVLNGELYDHLLTDVEDEIVLKEIIGANKHHMLGITPGEYVIGHRLAEEYIRNVLKKLKDPVKEINKFYRKTDKDKLTYLLWEKKLEFSSYTLPNGEAVEAEEVEKILKKMGVKYKGK